MLIVTIELYTSFLTYVHFQYPKKHFICISILINNISINVSMLVLKLVIIKSLKKL
jgi:uncharacterized membrane protein YesL